MVCFEVLAGFSWLAVEVWGFVLPPEKKLLESFFEKKKGKQERLEKLCENPPPTKQRHPTTRFAPETFYAHINKSKSKTLQDTHPKTSIHSRSSSLQPQPTSLMKVVRHKLGNTITHRNKPRNLNPTGQNHTNRKSNQSRNHTPANRLNQTQPPTHLTTTITFPDNQTPKAVLHIGKPAILAQPRSELLPR